MESILNWIGTGGTVDSHRRLLVVSIVGVILIAFIGVVVEHIRTTRCDACRQSHEKPIRATKDDVR